MNARADAVQPKKILVVDDNEIILKTVSSKLRGAGYTPFTALDAVEALALVRQESLDLILLDINFPPDVYGEAWDGFRLLEWLRQVETARNVPIIMISSNESGPDLERAQKQRVTAFFRKPLDHVDLLNVIRETLAAGPAPAP